MSSRQKIFWDRIVSVSDSSMIRTIAYSFSDQKMRVQFNNGEEYEYQAVPAAMFGTIISADSVGRTFSKLRPSLDKLYTKV